MPEPPLGPIRPAMDLSCGRIVKDGYCGKPATTHFAWNDEAENGLCCDEHTAEAFALNWGADWHPVGEVCTMPDSVWVGSLFDPPGYCAWQQSDGEQVRAESRPLVAR